ncbi:hypothetical protein GCM10025865_03760 [Paraoerskovia sediminicola]|uniref:Acyltransferase 3 domain-containing protein n=1 Tax=Paraoerskovia sediminicola TaxID=1138587 RepID=A0ABN6X8H8_9CELL|nr:hypothetical protein GCM10025865_03760 [Paraoerskovia sediminicola]
MRAPGRIPRRGAAGASRRILGLDGLRAFAVLAVLVYHLAPDALPGGFLGVDVFFVVSGFLITTLLVRELRRDGKISLPKFWLRRARRLLPALGTVVVTAVIAARLIEPDLLVGIGRQVLGALTFSSNWLEIAAGQSYFDHTAPVLFQTFWSLAIEEQFYVLWPVLLVLILAVTRGARSRSTIALVGALVSAAAMAALYVPGADPTRVYYGTGTHVFGLLLGVSAAFWWADNPRILGGGRVRRWLPFWALAGLVVMMLLMRSDATFTYRGGIFLGSVLALVLVLACADATGSDPAASKGAFLRGLELRPVVWVGERSYGLYLWHWPVILLVQAVTGAQVGTSTWWWSTAAAVVITFGLTAASYRWIETPVRRDGFRATARRVRSSGAVIALIVVAVLAAAVVVVTAPRVSAAQLAVEQGQAALAAAQQDADDKAAEDKAADDADAEDKAAEDKAAEDKAAEDKAAEEKAAEEKAADEASAPITGDQISAFGDSVLSGAAPAMLSKFDGIQMDAKPIRKWIDAVPIVEKAIDAGTVRDVVVLNFGTNGGFQFEGSEAAVRKILDLIGPDRRVVLVNTVGVSYWVPDANKQLADIVSEYPNAVVADWNKVVRETPGILHSDNTHPNMEGIGIYADTVEKALATLPPA